MTSPDTSPEQLLVLREQLPLPRAYVAPRTPTEMKLAEIWCSVLTMDRIGIEDAYHDLGGDSFMASIIFAMIQETFQMAIPISILVTSPTIAALAEKLEASHAAP
jgi:acyl carrier protein